MEDFLFILVLGVSSLICFGIFRIIYDPLKNYLVKKNKLSEKLSKRIELVVIITLIVFSFAMFLKRNDRESSKEILEKISDIKLPKNHIIIKDNFKNNYRDYTIEYVIQFDKSSNVELIRNIQNSRYYNYPSKLKTQSKENIYEGVWKHSINGFLFLKVGEKESIEIIVDTVENRLQFKLLKV